MSTTEKREQPSRKCNKKPVYVEIHRPKTRAPKSKKDAKKSVPKSEKKPMSKLIKSAIEKSAHKSKERLGRKFVSSIIIKKWIEDNFEDKKPAVKRYLESTLTRLVEKGELIQFKNSFAVKESVPKKKKE